MSFNICRIFFKCCWSCCWYFGKLLALYIQINSFKFKRANFIFQCACEMYTLPLCCISMCNKCMSWMNESGFLVYLLHDLFQMWPNNNFKSEYDLSSFKFTGSTVCVIVYFYFILVQQFLSFDKNIPYILTIFYHNSFHYILN